MHFYLVCTTFVLLLLLYCVSSSVAVTEYHRCIHDYMTHRVGPQRGDEPPISSGIGGRPRDSDTSRILKEKGYPQGGWRPIRIKVFVKDLEKEGRYCAKEGDKIYCEPKGECTCTKDDVLTPEKKDILVKTILEEAIQLHSERLYVKPLKGKLVVPPFSNESICAGFTVPEEHRSKGVEDADMVLYVSAAPQNISESFAWAVTCATLGKKVGSAFDPGRPVVGVMNYAPKYILATSQRVRVAAHEIAHALGFSVNEMKRLKMVDVNDVRMKGKVPVVSSANTLRETRRQYNCNTTKGMELEDHRSFPQLSSDGVSLKGRLGPINSQRQHHQVGHNRHGLGGRGPSPVVPGSGGRDRGERPVGYRAQPGLPGSRGEDGHRVQGGRRNLGVVQGPRALARPSSPTHPANALTANVANVQDAPKEEKIIAVEKQRELPTPLNIFSHWKRRNAKDELMAGIVGAGYYTALTMAAFADMNYYMVDWDKEERMSWGKHSGCKLLDDKCVDNSQTQYTDMFCTTNETPLQCTSDRYALGNCVLQELKQLPRMRLPDTPSTALKAQSPPELPSHFQYFGKDKKGSPWRELMDHCPFITANSETWCTDGDKEKMSGSIIAPNSRCVKGEELKVKEKNIGDVCVKVSCRNDVVSVKYKGNDEWHPCAEGTKLNVDTTELKGRIVCPKYDDVCNTINMTLDEVEGPQPPKPKPETQPDTPKAKNPTTTAAKNPTAPTAQGTTVSTATTTTTSTPSTQGPATPNKQESVTHNGNTKSATATGKAAAGALDSKRNATTIDTNAMPALTSTSMNSGVSIEIPSTDVVAAPAAALFGPFVCFLLVTTMVAVS